MAYGQGENIDITCRTAALQQEYAATLPSNALPSLGILVVTDSHVFQMGSLAYVQSVPYLIDAFCLIQDVFFDCRRARRSLLLLLMSDEDLLAEKVLVRCRVLWK